MAHDRWHYAKPGNARKAGIEPCTCRGTRYPTKDHGTGMQWRGQVPGVSSRPSFPTKGLAEAWERQQEELLRQGVVGFDPSRGNVTFSTYADKVVKARYGHRKGGGYKSAESRLRLYMKPYFGEEATMRDNDITTSVVAGWLDWLRQKPKLRGTGPIGENTVELAWTLFHTIMRTAVEVDKIRLTHPCHGIVRPKRVRAQIMQVWEPTLVNAILEGIDDYYRPIPLLAATCGLRSGEAFAVAVENLQPLRNKLIVQHQVIRDDDTGEYLLTPPKFGRVRSVPLAPSVARLLTAHITEYGTTTMACTCCKGRTWRIITTHNGDLIHKTQFNKKVWGPTLRKVGLVPGDNTGIHNLRHHWVSGIIEDGADVGKVQKYCGHHSPVVTMNTYCHLFKSADKETADLIEKRFFPKLALVTTDHEKEDERDHG